MQVFSFGFLDAIAAAAAASVFLFASSYILGPLEWYMIIRAFLFV